MSLNKYACMYKRTGEQEMAQMCIFWPMNRKRAWRKGMFETTPTTECSISNPALDTPESYSCQFKCVESKRQAHQELLKSFYGYANNWRTPETWKLLTDFQCDHPQASKLLLGDHLQVG
jgi:hypothetical protein